MRDGVEHFLASKLAGFVPYVDPATGACPQREFLAAAAAYKQRSYRGGNQSGKTTGLVVDTLLQLYGWHPAISVPGPRHGWLSALDWEFGVGQILWPKVAEWLYWPLVRNVQWYRKEEPAIPQSIVLVDGSRLDFKSNEAGARKYQGTALHFVALDEEHDADVVQEARVRLVKHDGYLSWSLTPVRRERWVLDLERMPQTHVVRASMEGAARAGVLENRASVDAFLDSLTDRQRAVRGAGDYASPEGLVYPEFARAVHVARPRGHELVRGEGAHARPVCPWPLPSSWPRFASCDFGYGVPTSILVAALDPNDGTVIVYRCYYAAGVRASRWASLVAGDPGKRPPIAPALQAPIVCDHDAFERAEFHALGVRTLAADKEVVPGLETVERFLHQRPDGKPSVVFVLEDGIRHPETGRCDAYHLVEELEGYRYHPTSSRSNAAGPKDLPIKKDDHACDALRYLLRFLEKRQGGAPRPPGVASVGRAPGRSVQGVGLAAPRR